MIKFFPVIIITAAIFAMGGLSRESKGTQTCRIYTWAHRTEAERCFDHEVMSGVRDDKIICSRMDVTCP